MTTQPKKFRTLDEYVGTPAPSGLYCKRYSAGFLPDVSAWGLRVAPEGNLIPGTAYLYVEIDDTWKRETAAIPKCMFLRYELDPNAFTSDDAEDEEGELESWDEALARYVGRPAPEDLHAAVYRDIHRHLKDNPTYLTLLELELVPLNKLHWTTDRLIIRDGEYKRLIGGGVATNLDQEIMLVPIRRRRCYTLVAHATPSAQTPETREHAAQMRFFFGWDPSKKQVVNGGDRVYLGDRVPDSPFAKYEADE